MDANSTLSGNQQFNDILVSTEHFSRAGQLKFVDDILYGEVGGDGVADFSIEVNNVNQMVLNDFIL